MAAKEAGGSKYGKPAAVWQVFAQLSERGGECLTVSFSSARAASSLCLMWLGGFFVFLDAQFRDWYSVMVKWALGSRSCVFSLLGM